VGYLFEVDGMFLPTRPWTVQTGRRVGARRGPVPRWWWRSASETREAGGFSARP